MATQSDRSQDNKLKLMQAAREEFLKYGFEKASLRTICKKAGMTTGALYFFFRDKDDLFCQLTENVVSDVKTMMIAHTEQERKDYAKGRMHDATEDREMSRMVIQYACRHREECVLLIEKSEGSSRQGFIDEIIAIMQQGFLDMVRLYSNIPGMEKVPAVFNECTIHWLAHVQVEAYLHIISHNLDEEEALKQADIVTEFLLSGFDGLLKSAMSSHREL